MELAVRLGVQDTVRFHGRRDHDGVIELLRSSDLFCFPTTAAEGFPKAVLEALACGVPVVTTRVSVLGELVGRGGGLLLDEATSDAVAEGVSRCLADSTRYSMMSSAGLSTARSYSLERWRDVIGERLSAGWGPLRAHV